MVKKLPCFKKTKNLVPSQFNSHHSSDSEVNLIYPVSRYISMTSPFYPRHITLFTPYFGPWFLVVSPCCFNPSSWQNSWYCWPVYLIFLDHTVDGCEIHRQKDGWNPRNHGNNHQLVQDVWTIRSRSLFLLPTCSEKSLPVAAGSTKHSQQQSHLSSSLDWSNGKFTG